MTGRTLRAASPEPRAATATRIRIMRHRVSHRKLGRVTEHRIAMLRNQASALLKYEHIETTVPKAKELRPFVERIITIAKRGLAAGDGQRRTLHARRLVLRDIQDRDVVEQAVRHDRAALRGAAGRLHADPPARLPPRRQRRGRADRAGRQRVRPERRQRRSRTKAEAKKPKGVGGRLRAAAAAAARQEGRGRRRRGGRGRRAKKAKPARDEEQVGQVRHARQGQDDRRAAQSGGS